MIPPHELKPVSQGYLTHQDVGAGYNLSALEPEDFPVSSPEYENPMGRGTKRAIPLMSHDGVDAGCDPDGESGFRYLQSFSGV